MNHFGFNISIFLGVVFLFLFSNLLVGQEFELFNYQEGSILNHIKYDSTTNRVWLCEDNSYPPLKYFENGNFTEIAEDISSTTTGMDVGTDGDVWITTFYGVYKSDGENLTHFTEDNAPFFSDAAKAVLVTDEAVYIGFDLELWKWQNEEWTEIAGISNYIFSLAYDDENDILYVGGQYGLQKVENDVVTTFDEVPFTAVQELEMDQLGNLWMRSYENGMAKFNGTEFTHYTVDNSGLLSDDLSAIGLDAENRVWFSYDVPFIDDLGVFDGENWLHYNDLNSTFPEGYSVYSIAAGKEDDLWLGTFRGLIHLTFMSTGISHSPEFSLILSPNPAQDLLCISSSESVNGMATIFSTTGQLISNQVIEKKLIVNVQDFPKGMYFLKVENQHGQLTKRFVVH